MLAERKSPARENAADRGAFAGRKANRGAQKNKAVGAV
jgi:hypothetical protein